MWQSFRSFQSDPRWGLHLAPLADEAARLQAGAPLAACISTLELIRVSGPDAESFLQGQVTCDMREVAAGAIRLGAHCNIKGRVQASFYGMRQGADMVLLVPQGQGEATRAALARYALFSKATLSLEPHWGAMALLGGARDAAIPSRWEQAPAPGHSVESEAGVLARLDDRTDLALVPLNRAADLLQTLENAGVGIVGDNVWWLAQLQAGIAQILPAQSEAWIPQEINYDLINGVSFRKGCYKGQEIVARIHYRGQTKVRAHLLEIRPDTATEPGTRIVSAEGQNIGTVLQCAFVNDDTLLAIAALKTDIPESEPLHLEPNESSQIRLVPMPYAITNS